MQCSWQGPQLSVYLGEMSACGKLKMQCLYVAGTMTGCLLRRGVYLLSWEVSVSGSSTVHTCTPLYGIELELVLIMSKS